MSEDTAAPATPPSATAASPAAPAATAQGSPLILIGVCVAAVALGGVGGAMLIGPRLLPASRTHAAAHADSTEVGEGEDEGKEGGSGHGGEHGEEKRPMLRMDNLIVNPAGSQGTRFLMATVAFEVGDPKIEAKLREREVQVRDAVIGVLEHQTMEQVTRPYARDSIKVQLEAAVRPLAGKNAKLRAYLPQFVIQ